MGLKIRGYVIIIFFSILIIFSCKATPEASRGDDGSRGTPRLGGEQNAGSLAEEIRNLTETGILSSMVEAMELIRARNLSNVDFGRMMNGINITLIKLIYPDYPTRLPNIDIPRTYNYSRIIREAERGNYIRPQPNSVDFFEHILPFLALNERSPPEILQDALRDLEKAATLRPNSILPHYFRGVIHERAGRFPQAEESYGQAYQISNECYPAQIGIARVKRLAGDTAAATAIFADLVTRYPDSMEIKRQIAITHFENKDWSRALSAVDEILRSEPRNGEFLLMRAEILIEMGNFSQANTSLDNYAPINPNNRSYLFMRARVQAEGNRNRDSALNYLRSILRSNANDVEALVYAAGLLLESSRPADQIEGREMLVNLRQQAGSSIEVMALALRDAIQRESWLEAQGYLNRILAVRRTVADLTDAYYVERGLGNHTRALTYARELYERNTSNNDYTFIYISALIDSNRRDEASRLLENRLNSTAGGVVKSRYFYLRSRLQPNTDAALGDLRSSLFEDPRNLDALIAMFEIYHNRREDRRAVYYLRQALAIAPDHPLLKRYETEYASLLGRN